MNTGRPGMPNIKHIRELVVDTLEQIERRSKAGEISGISSGFKDIDEHFDGWQPQLYVLGGRPSMGKSALIKDFALNAAMNGHKPHVINIEDGNYNTVKRILATVTGLELWKIRKGRMKQEEWTSIVEESARLTELELTFDDTATRVEPIKKSILEAHQAGADIVFIDYLQLIQGDDETKGKKRLEEIGDITRELKEATKPSNLNIPIIVAAQLNRSVEMRENKRPILADLRDSGEIEQHSDVVMFIFRESYYTKDDENKKAELIVAKGRNEGTATIELYFDDMKTRFLEYSKFEL
jgi:replicative DNA helicase